MSFRKFIIISYFWENQLSSMNLRGINKKYIILRERMIGMAERVRDIMYHSLSVTNGRQFGVLFKICDIRHTLT